MHRTKRRTLAVFAMMLAASLPGELLADADSPRITVTGTASVRVPPDRVSFSVGVETQGVSVAQAFQSNGRKLESLVAALKGKGIQAKEIQTSNLEVTSRDADGKKLVGYRVSALVTVTREDPNGVGELLQAAITAGANQAGELRFFVADPAHLQARGLELAFQDARGKAEVLATLSKRTLGSVLSVTEAGGWDRSGMQSNAFNALAYVGGGGVQSGSEQVPFAITVVFELK